MTTFYGATYFELLIGFNKILSICHKKTDQTRKLSMNNKIVGYPLSTVWVCNCNVLYRYVFLSDLRILRLAEILDTNLWRFNSSYVTTFKQVKTKKIKVAVFSKTNLHVQFHKQRQSKPVSQQRQIYLRCCKQWTTIVEAGGPIEGRCLFLRVHIQWQMIKPAQESTW